MFTYAAFLVAAQIAVLASGAPTSAPTTVPTSVPTSAPTSAPGGAGGLAGILGSLGLDSCILQCQALQDAMAPSTRRLAGHGAAGGTPSLPAGLTPCSIATMCLNETAVTEACTASMTAEGVAALQSQVCSAGANGSATETVTSFTVKLNVANASEFNQTAYLASIAATTGSDAANVVVTSVTFVVSASYSFAEDITAADIKTAMATNAGVPESQVNVTVTTVRRLGAGEGRRLAITADVSISTTDAATANSAKTAATDATAFATQLSTVTGSTVAAPTVTAAPAMAVIVETEVVSTSGTAVTAPTATALASDLSTRTGVTITAEVTNVATTTRAAPTPAPPAPAPAAPAAAPSPPSTSTSSASKVLATKALLSGLLAPLFALLLNAAF